MKPSISGRRPGGRNRQFFDSLSGFARGIDAAIARNQIQAHPTKHTDAGLARDANSAAQSKRERKAAARARSTYGKGA